MLRARGGLQARVGVDFSSRIHCPLIVGNVRFMLHFASLMNNNDVFPILAIAVPPRSGFISHREVEAFFFLFSNLLSLILFFLL